MVDNCDFINLLHTCAYKDCDTADETDVFQSDFLTIFNVKEYNDDVCINMDKLYLILNENNSMKELFMSASKVVLIENKPHIGYMLLFSFENLYLFYPCVCDLLVNGYLNEDSLTNFDILKKSF